MDGLTTEETARPMKTRAQMSWAKSLRTLLPEIKTSIEERRIRHLEVESNEENRSLV